MALAMAIQHWRPYLAGVENNEGKIEGRNSLFFPLIHHVYTRGLVYIIGKLIYHS